MEVSGKIYKVDETKQVTERFRKRELVVEIEDGRYPQTVLFQLTGDRCEMLDGFAVGDEIKLDFNLRGREWTSPKGEVKFFNSLDVYRLEKLGAQQGQSADEPPLPDEPPGWVDDDLPF